MATSSAYSTSRDDRHKYSPSSNFYLQPRTPSTASTPRLNRAASSFASSNNSSRKRSRNDDRDARPWRASFEPYSSNDWDSVSSSTSKKSPRASPPPLANSRYRLARGLDSPTAAYSAESERFADPSEKNIRIRYDSKSQWTDSQSRNYSHGALEREGNGKKRKRSFTESPPESWPQYMFRVAGGLAGSVWGFCRSTAFKGFTAGGGPGHAMEGPRPEKVEASHGTQTRRRRSNSAVHSTDASASSTRGGMGSTPIPGKFPEDDFEMIGQVSEEEEVGRRPTKRLQTSQAGDWVVVDNLQRSTSKRLSADDNSSSFSPQRSYLPRPTASRAILGRRPRTSTARLSSGSYSTPTHTGYVRSASVASARSPVTTPQGSTIQPTPASADIQKFEKRRKREDRKTDAKMRDFNDQLAALIQTGKQALASKVEVEDEVLAPQSSGNRGSREYPNSRVGKGRRGDT